MNNRELPPGVEQYAQSPEFTAKTLPESLQEAHNTKSGTYGRLRVKTGKVTYFLEGQKEPFAEVPAGETFIILPEERHYVRVTDDTVFHIEFCR